MGYFDRNVLQKQSPRGVGVAGSKDVDVDDRAARRPRAGGDE